MVGWLVAWPQTLGWEREWNELKQESYGSSKSCWMLLTCWCSRLEAWNKVHSPLKIHTNWHNTRKLSMQKIQNQWAASTAQLYRHIVVKYLENNLKNHKRAEHERGGKWDRLVGTKKTQESKSECSSHSAVGNHKIGSLIQFNVPLPTITSW